MLHTGYSIYKAIQCIQFPLAPKIYPPHYYNVV
nr:MAG TPA: protein of unknown function (UPF0223) [Crassvirales sp.]